MLAGSEYDQAPIFMTSQAPPRLFVVHAAEDTAFVDGYLLPSLGLPQHDVLTSRRLEPGEPIVEAIARAVTSVTVLVLSPFFRACPWASWAEMLAQYHAIEGGTVIPLLLTDWPQPLLSRFRVSLDCREPSAWDGQLERLRDRLRTPAPPPDDVRCPYPGLRPFRLDEGEHFVGREREIDEILQRLRLGDRELYVIGPSGSGKSSLIRAGLQPQLIRSPERAGASFAVVTTRPGADPPGALAAALEEALAQPAERCLIVVDQLEEIFSSDATAGAPAFYAKLRTLRRDHRVVLLFTLRADFFGAFMDCPLWTDLDGRVSRIEIAPLRGDALRRAIETPARQVGVYLEPALLVQLLSDIADEPGGLPLLQETLFALWHRRARNLLRLSDYGAMGTSDRSGLAVTIANVADHALQQLTTARQVIARRILLRLVHFGEGRGDTRRRQARAALTVVGDAAAELDAVIDHLAVHRLVTVDGADNAGLDLAHEILLSTWPTLQMWIASGRVDEARRRTIDGQAATWVASGRGESGLLDDGELIALDAWLTTTEISFGEDASALIAASRSARDARHAREAAIAATERAYVAQIQRQLALHHTARAHTLLQQSRAAEAAPYLLAARALGVDDTPLRTMFRQARLGLSHARIVCESPIVAFSWSVDDRFLFTVSADRTRRIWDAETGELARTVLPAGPECPPTGDGVIADMSRLEVIELVLAEDVVLARWSPDRRFVAVTGGWAVQVWDAWTEMAQTSPLLHDGWIRSLAWSPDGKLLATACTDRSIRVWSSTTGDELASLHHDGPVDKVVWSDDGARLAYTSGDVEAARVWDISKRRPEPPIGCNVDAIVWTGRRDLITASRNNEACWWLSDMQVARFEHPGPARFVALGPDNAFVAVGGEREVRIWHRARGQAVGTGGWGPAGEFDGKAPVSALAASPDRSRLAVAFGSDIQICDFVDGTDRSVRLEHGGDVLQMAWDHRGRCLASLDGQHAVQVWRTNVSRTRLPQGVNRLGQTRIASKQDERVIRIIDANTAHVVTSEIRSPDVIDEIVWSPDQERLATASGSVVRIWDVRTGEQTTAHHHHGGGYRPPSEASAILVGPPDRVVGAAWSPDGAYLATAYNDHVCLIDPRTRHEVRTLRGHTSLISLLLWNRDGTRIATGAHDRVVRVWDAATANALMEPLRHSSSVMDVSWSPDGETIATRSDDVRVWDVASGRSRVLPGGRCAGLAWSPCGTMLATGSHSGVQIWDARTARPTGPAFDVERARSIAWSPDGSLLATSDHDGHVWVWDRRTARAVLPPLRTRADRWRLEWSEDGAHLTMSGDGAEIWDVGGARGTLEEWRSIVENGPYALTDDGALVRRR